MRTTPARSPRSRVLSPKRSNLSSIGEDDAGSAYGSFSVYSAGTGHDDPTAVMGNVKPTRSQMSLGTIASFLTAEFDDDIEARQDLDEADSTDIRDNDIRDKDLREQLAELDQTANLWNVKNSYLSGDSSETPDIEKFYVNEVGDNSPTQRWQKPDQHSFPEKILEDIETNHVLEQDDGHDHENLSAHGMFMPPGLVVDHQLSLDDGRPIEYISSDQSQTSTDQASTIVSVLSDDSQKEQSSVHDDQRDFGAGSLPATSLHTDEIVRQVQLRLLESSENDTKTESAEAHLRKVTPLSLEDSLPYQSILQVHAQQTYEDTAASETKHGVQNRRHIITAAFCCGVLGVALALIFSLTRVGSSSDELASPPNGVMSPAPSAHVEAIPSPNPSTFVRTDSPALAPARIPSFSPEDPAPTLSPHTSLRPTPVGFETKSPLFTTAPTFVELRLDTEAPSKQTFPPGSVSLTAAPTELNNQTFSAKRHLMKISGDLLEDPTTPQYSAYQWLVKEDPANLDLDSLPIKTLEQRYIAALLYFSTIGSEWENTFDFLTEADVCEWKDNRTSKGILCDSEGTIEDITINENGLRGSLPFELKALPALKKLELRTNRIGGSVPPQLGELSMLEELDIRQNVLVGTFPKSIFGLPNMKKLFMLQNTNLEGTIPESIQNAKSLQMISFNRCKLSGSLPDGIGKLSDLYFVALLGNKMTGSIPEGLTRLPKLEVLELGSNNFTGTIPDFAEQTELYFVSFPDNKLTGTIPASIGRLKRLLFLDVRDNSLSGPMPGSLNEVPELVTFYASRNSLTGTLPNFAGNVGFLQAIDLSGNQLSGDLNNFLLSTADELLTIDIPNNATSGTVPPVGRFSRLASLALNNNRISGSIPSEIIELQMLDTLLLGGNKLGGTIPDEFSRLVGLKYIDLSNNDFAGTISETWKSLQSLSVLDLSNNRFSGTLPSGLENLRNLDELYLQNNSFTGNVNEILCPNLNASKIILKFVSDCGGENAEVVCSCCTSCCTDINGCPP